MEPEYSILASRGAEVLCEVVTSGWELYRPVCEVQLLKARQLWLQVEGLIEKGAECEVDVEDEQSLMVQCQELLGVCDRWVSSEEEILELNDLSAETYVFAHVQHDLVWRKEFYNES
jgi:hypothetical protein